MAIVEKTVREQRVEAIARLADDLGRTPLRREIAEHLGISISYASALVADPDGSLERERKARYAGTCEKCGGPTCGSDGRAKAPKQCMACITGDPDWRTNGRAGTRPPGQPRRRWNEQLVEDAIVAWIEKNRRIPRLYDFVKADPDLPAPCVGTIYRYCYRFEPRERDFTYWNGKREVSVTRHWKEITRGWADVLVDLVPRLPIEAIVRGARNATTRARLFEAVGVETLVLEHGECIGHDDVGTLWRLDDEGWPEPVVMVGVVNSTPEPDGSFRDYFLRVPPTVQTPREAVAWTFGVEAEEYEPAIET